MSSYDDLTKEEKTELSAHSNPAFLFVITGMFLVGVSYSLGWVLMASLGGVAIGMGIIAFMNMCKTSREICEKKYLHWGEK